MKLKRSAKIALRRSGRCRLCDPPQAENPAKQDSFSIKALMDKMRKGKAETTIPCF